MKLDCNFIVKKPKSWWTKGENEKDACLLVTPSPL